MLCVSLNRYFITIPIPLYLPRTAILTFSHSPLETARR